MTRRLLLLCGCLAVLVAYGCIDSKSTSNLAPRENSAADYGDLLAVTPSLPNSKVKDYEGFRLSFNRSNHTPDWVAWELLASETDGAIKRKDCFWQDEHLKGCPAPADYKRSGYDKGHMCPSADQKWSDKANEDCFVMANMCPQDQALNRGAWQTLEKKERLWAQRDGSLIIVAGPIYTDADTRRIGDSGVRVPSTFYKVILAPYIDKPRAIGFIYPNAQAPGNMQNYSMSVDEVEKITGLDFFSSLPDDIEDVVESQYSFREWNRP